MRSSREKLKELLKSEYNITDQDYIDSIVSILRNDHACEVYAKVLKNSKILREADFMIIAVRVKDTLKLEARRKDHGPLGKLADNFSTDEGFH